MTASYWRAAALLAVTLGAVPASHAEPFVFTLNGNFYGAYSIAGAPIADGTPFTETARFDTLTPNLLASVPGSAIYVPSQASIAFGGTTYAIAPYAAAQPYGVAVVIFDRSSPFPFVPEYGVGLLGNPVPGGAGIIADFTSATPNITAGNLTSTVFPASSYVGSGVQSGQCISAPSTCFTPAQVEDVEPYPLTANGVAYALSFPSGPLVTYTPAANDPNAPPPGFFSILIDTPSSASLTDVPEPSSWLMLGIGLAVMSTMYRRRRG